MISFVNNNYNHYNNDYYNDYNDYLQRISSNKCL